MRAITIKLGSEGTPYKPINTSYYLGRDPWISAGRYNTLFEDILDLDCSPTHSSCLYIKSLLTSGNGFLFDEKNKKLKEYIDDYDINDVLEKIGKEQVRWGGFSLQLLPSRGGQPIIKHLPLMTLRAKNEEEVRNYYFSKNWRYNRRPEFTPKLYPAYVFGENKITDVRSNFIVYSFDYIEGQYYYPLPDYRDSILWIRTEKLLSIHQNKNVKNGFISTGIVEVYDMPNEDDQDEFVRDFRDNNIGVDNSGEITFVFPTGEKGLKFTETPNRNNADIYENVTKTCEQKIVNGHRLTSKSIASLGEDGGSIFTNGLSTSYEYFSNTVIRGYQKPILKVFRKLFKEMGLIKNDDELQIKSLNPIQFVYDSNTNNSIMLIDELRSNIGLPPLLNGAGQVTPASVTIKTNAENNPIPPAGIKPGIDSITKGDPKSTIE